jgi:DNA invertase Pin-like site-specific DNA recombinase
MEVGLLRAKHANLVLLVNELRQGGIHLKSLTDSIDTSSPMCYFIFDNTFAL